MRKVTLPLIAPSITATALLAYAISLNDFIVTTFNARQTSTFPLFIYNASRQSVPPQVNVLATTLLLLVLSLIVLNVLLQQRFAQQDTSTLRPAPAPT